MDLYGLPTEPALTADRSGPDDYRKSSFTTDNNCVEVRRDLACARDSKDRNGAVLAVRGMPTFVAFAASGKFQRPAA